MNWRYANTVLAVAVLGNFSQLGSRLLVSPVVPDVIDAFGVSKAAVGLALTGMWASYALLQYPSGVLADRRGERGLLLVALAATGTGCVLLSLSPSFAAFGLFAVLLGGGAGLYYSVAASLLAGLYENVGGVLGLLAAGGSTAGLVVPVVSAALGVRFGWRAAPLFGAAVAFAALGLAVALVRPTDPANPAASLSDRFRPAAVYRLLSRPGLAFTTALGVITMFAFQSFSSFFPTFLVEYRSFSTGEASAAFAAVFVLSAVLLPVVGRLSDRVPRDAVLVATFSLAATGFAVLVLGRGLAATAAGVVVVGTGFSWGGALQSRFMARLADDERGSGFGLVRTVYMLLGATGSAVTGALADGPGWATAFGLVAALLAAGVCLLAANRALDLGL